VNALDAITLFLIVAALILGWRSGAIPQISGLIGAIAGGVSRILALPYLADPLSAIDPAIRPIVAPWSRWGGRDRGGRRRSGGGARRPAAATAC
jgi:hypothetical protein